MGTPSKTELEKLLAIKIETPEQYEQAIQQAEMMRELGITQTYVEQIPKEIQAQVAIYSNPTLTDQQRKEKLQEIEVLKRSGQMGTFGGFEETSVKPSENINIFGFDTGISFGGVGLPFQTESAFKSDTEVLSQSVKRQQDIGDVRAKLERPSMLNAKKTLQEQLTEHYAELPEPDRNSLIKASTMMFDQIVINNPDINQEDAYRQTIDQLNNLFSGEVEYITSDEAERLDPRMKQKFEGTDTGGLLARAVGYQNKTGTMLPMFTDEQLAFLQTEQNEKYGTKIKQYQDTFVPAELESVSMKVLKLGKGDVQYVPVEVADYILNNPLGGVVYSPERDLQIYEELKRQEKVQSSLEPKIPGTSIKIPSPLYPIASAYRISERPVSRDISANRTAQNALARVKAYKELGNPDWKQTLDQRKHVLENLERYDKSGFFTDDTALGGTTETSLSWVLRNAFSPLALTAVLGTNALNVVGGTIIGAGAELAESKGFLPELPEGESYIDPQYTRRLREQERPEVYKGYGLIGEIADNIARFKGFTGEGIAIAQEMNLDGLAFWGTVGGYFITDLADPSFDIGTGVISGGSAFGKSLNAQKKIHAAPSYREALKVAKSAALQEIPLANHGIRQFKKITGKEAPIKDIHKGDVVLSMKDNIARNLNAERLAKQGSSVDELIDQGFGDTNYVQLLRKATKENPTTAQQVASGLFRKKLMENTDTAKMLRSYDETSKVVQEAVQSNNPLKELVRIKSSGKAGRLTDFTGAQKAIKTALEYSGDIKVNALRNVDKLYATPMFLRLAPGVKALDDMSWITRNTIVHKSRIPRINALAAQSKIGKLFGKLIKGPIEDINLIAAQRPTTQLQYDVFGRGQQYSLGKTEKAFDLSNLQSSQIDEMVEALDQLDLPPTLKSNIIDNMVNEKVLFQSDFNQISNMNKDLIARFDDGAITVQDVDRLTVQNATRLLEGRGTVGRNAQISSIFGKRSSETRQRLINEISAPTLPTQSSLNFQQTRLIKEFEQEMGTFSIRSQELFETLQSNNPEIINRYLNNVPTTPLNSQQILAIMTTGERQSTNLGRAAQVEGINQSMMYLLNNMFIAKGGSKNLNASQVDKANGISEFTRTEIWSSFGRDYIDAQLTKISGRVMNNPTTYFDELSELVKDLNRRIQDPDARLVDLQIQTEKGIETIRQPLIDDTLDAKTVLPVTEELLNKNIGTLGLASYYVAESERVISNIIANNVLKDLPKLSIKNLVPTSNITQKKFESMVRNAATQIYSSPTGVVNKQELLNLNRMNQMDEVLKTPDIKIDVYNVEKSVEGILNKYFRERNKIAKVSNKQLQRNYKKMATKRVNQLEKTIDANHKQQKASTVQRIESQREALKAKGKDVLKEEKNKMPFLDRWTPEVQRIYKTRDTKVNKLKTKKQSTNAMKVTSKAASNRKARLLQSIDNAIKDANRTANNKIQRIISEKGEVGILSTKLRQVVKASEKEVKDFNKLSKEFIRREEASLRQVKEAAMKSEKQLLLNNQPPSQAIVTKENIKNLIVRQSDQSVEDYIKLLASSTGSPVLHSAARKINALDELSDASAVVYAAEDQANIILRNNNLSNGMKGTVQSMQESINKIFGKGNEGYAAAIFGRGRYEEMKRLYGLGNQSWKESIISAIRQDKSNGAMEAVQTLNKILNNALYVNLLGWRIASHTRNTVTAPTIVYQTTGVLLSTNNIKKGFGVVKNGQAVTARNYGKIAVRTPSGEVYTNGDLFKILQKAGVRNQFEFLQSALSDNSAFVKQLNRMKGNTITDFVYNFVRSTKKWTVDKPLYLQSLEDYTFRSAVLVNALEEGRSVQEAASLARRSMFDYGDISPALQKVFRTALVFSSFTYQNLKNGLYALTQPKVLMRYGKMIRAHQSVNTIMRSLNEDKQLPYQMYFPVFAQQRVTYELNTYNDRTSFIMSPPVPAIDSIITIASGVLGSLKNIDGIDSKDVDGIQFLVNLIQPIYKEILPFNRKYESGLAKPELITFVRTYKDLETPADIAQYLEEAAGGRVIPRPAKPNDKNVIDGYVYPLSAAQRKKLYHQSMYTILVLTGVQAQIMDHIQLFAPEGTTHANQSLAVRLGDYLGLYSISQAMPQDVRIERQMNLVLSELDKIKRKEETLTEGAIFRDQQFILPSEEK